MAAMRGWGTVLVLGACITAPAFADGQLECTSTHYQYQYCRANTGNSVRLAHQQSKSSCDYGRSWGYDGRGIWVDNGCGAIFEYGYGGGAPAYGGGGHHHHGGDDSGAVVAGAAALVILGAIASNSSHHSHHDHGQVQYEQEYASVPAWAVGRFSGSDDVSGTPIDVSIDGGGNINGYYGHQSLNGQWSGGRAYLGNRGYNASPNGNGIRLVADDGGMVINLYRN